MGLGFSSAKESHLEGWAQWLFPSIADLIFLAFLGVLSFSAISIRLLGDAGIGWHIRTGQIILATHSVQRVDPFSSSMAGQPWFAWEWLYDIGVGWSDRAVGLNGVILFTAFTIALTFSWVFCSLVRRGTNLPVAVLLLLLAASASMIHFFARPHVVSWLLTVVWFSILDRSEVEQPDSSAGLRLNQRRLWLLPLLMLLWVNVHGGFLVGFVLLGIYWLGAVWDWLRTGGEKFETILQNTRAGKRARHLAAVGVSSALATLVNPYGWKLHLHIYRYLSNRFLMDHIEEFQSPNFHGIAQKCFAILLLLTLVALAVGKRRSPSTFLSEILLILFAAYAGLYASRNLPVSSLLLILVIGPRLSSAFGKAGDGANRRWLATSDSQPVAKAPFLDRMRSLDSRARGHLWSAAGFALIVWIAFHGGKFGASPLMDAHFDAKRFPVAAVDYLEQRNVKGEVFAPDSWGGYLIYRLYPRTKVVVDDRHDFYGEEFLKGYLRTVHVEPGWENFLVVHNVGCIVVPKASALASILLESPRWQSVYADDAADIFEPISGTLNLR